ncbi:hypothetical protein AB1Y20_002110 [Prymnesium parvum]|uniref:Exostosin GT47 domain-containing protein n=1 Tax=Prymnesium parvum TaxID=97485 RepID=A0AB34J8H3_PRYPA
MRWAPASYDEFWSSALHPWLDLADASAHVDVAAAQSEDQLRRCPRVFVYDFRGTPLADSFKPTKAYASRAFGPPMNNMTGVRISSQFALAMALAHRLVRSPCYTANASQADLFFVPIKPLRKFAWQWPLTCEKMLSELSQQGKTFESFLPHLNRGNAAKHFMVFSHDDVGSYWKCCGWWIPPAGLLDNSVRVAYMQALSDNARSHNYMASNNSIYALTKKSKKAWAFFDDLRQVPNLISVPIMSSVHWEQRLASRSAPPWEAGWVESLTKAPARKSWLRNSSNDTSIVIGTGATAERVHVNVERPILMLYVGGNGLARAAVDFAATVLTNDKSANAQRPVKNVTVRVGDADVREAISRVCKEYTRDECRVLPFTTDVLRLKRKAVFCLEPTGVFPQRKSIADSVALGCIPVLFNKMADEVVTSWIVPASLANLSRVLVPREAFLRGEVDLRKLLMSVPTVQRSLMQKVAVLNARRFQMSVDDMPGDAMYTLLWRIQRQANIPSNKGNYNGSHRTKCAAAINHNLAARRHRNIQIGNRVGSKVDRSKRN